MLTGARLNMDNVFILYRQTFHNDIDHVECWDDIGVFSSQIAAIKTAKQIYNKEHPNRRYPDVIENTLDWSPCEYVDGIETHISGIDEYRAECGNFMIIKHPVKDAP